MNHKIYRKQLFSLLILLLLVLPFPGAAQAAGELPDPEQRCDMLFTMKKDGQAVPGGSFTLYRVGELVLEDGAFQYVLTDEFEDSHITLGDLSSRTLPHSLRRYIREQAVSGTEQKIGPGGKAHFTDLEQGLYLAVQTRSAPGYYPVSSFLFALPYQEDGVWNYSLEASPKSEILPPPDTPPNPDNPEPPEPTEPPSPEPPGPDIPSVPYPEPPTPDKPHLPQTGQLNWPVPLLAAGGILLFMIGWLMYDRANKKPYTK